ncbi:LysR family transcriptional regulator [Providencia alcalifaciens]
MDIRGLRYFVEVVQQNNFSRAADKLYVTQPAISRSIQKLEQELEVTLLIRETDGVKLTDDGEILFRHAQQILAQFDSLNNALKDKSGPLTGILKVGLPPVIASTYFADIIMAFSQKYPQVELQIIELSSNHMMNAMLKGDVETAAVMSPFDEQRFNLYRFATDRLMLLVNEKHPLATQNNVKFSELLNEPFIFFQDSFRINELVVSACGIYGKKPIIAGRSGHLDLVMAMVRAGVGITLLPESMWKKNHIEGLSIIPVTEPILAYELALATLKESHPSRRATAWIELALEMLNMPSSL